jgi:stage II sporulation protein D
MESQIIRIFLALLLSCSVILQSTISHAEGSLPAGPMIRVAVLVKAKDFMLKVRGSYKIYDESQTLLREGRNLQETVVQASSKGIYFGVEGFSTQRIRVSTDKDFSLFVAGVERRYRGMLDVVVDEKSLITAVNILDLETYTKGVLFHEVSHRWPLEAIKAQAVATRTYALYQSQQNKEELYDVKSDIYSQVYGGKSAERYRTNIAANRTYGQLLTYNGKVLPAYFHATCGGRTEDVREVWPKHGDLPPLRGIQCDYCVFAPHYRWTKNFKSKDIQDLLNKNGYHIDLIEDIRVIERTKSGRIKTIEISTRAGKEIQISGKKFREIVGPNNLKSNFFDIEMKGYFFDLKGKGWGHGVGMCQWGAYYMSLQNFKYREILNYYYPGAEIAADVYDNPSNYMEAPPKIYRAAKNLSEQRGIIPRYSRNGLFFNTANLGSEG